MLEVLLIKIIFYSIEDFTCRESSIIISSNDIHARNRVNVKKQDFMILENLYLKRIL